MPFVPQEGGAPAGLSEREHFEWARWQTHPMQVKMENMNVDDDVKDATKREITTPEQEIEDFREAQVDGLLLREMHSEHDRLAWQSNTPKELQEVNSELQGPLAGWLKTVTDMPKQNRGLCNKMGQGFSVRGHDAGEPVTNHS